MVDMIYLTVGMPSRFSEWCEGLFHALLESNSTEPVNIVNTDSLEGIGRKILTGGSAHVIIVSRQPHAGIEKLLVNGKIPFLLLLDEPQNCARALEVDYDYDCLSAIRSVANSCAALLPLVNSPDALILRNTGDADAVKIGQDISKHFGFDWPVDRIRATAEQPRFSTFETPVFKRNEKTDASISDIDLALVKPMRSVQSEINAVLEGALNSMWNALQGGKLREVVWHKNLFYTADRSDSECPSVIDVTGLARCLIFGPYIRLCEGAWSCTLAIGCSEESVGLRFAVNVFAGVQLSDAIFKFEEPGVFEVDLPFVIMDADKLVEVRVFSVDAALEGSIQFSKVTITPLEKRRLPVAAA
jgi:hypothetical protein